MHESYATGHEARECTRRTARGEPTAAIAPARSCAASRRGSCVAARSPCSRPPRPPPRRAQRAAGWLGVVADGPLGAADARRVGPDGDQRRRERARRGPLVRAPAVRPRRRRAARRRGALPRRRRGADRLRAPGRGRRRGGARAGSPCCRSFSRRRAGRPERPGDAASPAARSRDVRALPGGARAAATGRAARSGRERPELPRDADPRLADLERAEHHAATGPSSRSRAPTCGCCAPPHARSGRPTAARRSCSPGCRTRAGRRCARSTRPAARGHFDAVALHPYTARPANVLRIVRYARRVMRKAATRACRSG